MALWVLGEFLLCLEASLFHERASVLHGGVVVDFLSGKMASQEYKLSSPVSNDLT